MNYQFIIENSRVIQLHKLFIYSVFILWIPIYGQEINVDSIAVNKTWIDMNGKNSLSVKVNALCNPNNPPFDGHKTLIEASLKNKNHKLSVVYDDENYEMEMLLFYEKDIWFYQVNKIKAIFIPFFYCSNSDTDAKVSYIIFYNHKKYLYHINYYCGEDSKCKLIDDLNKKLKGLPTKLKTKFCEVLKTKYTKNSDFHRD